MYTNVVERLKQQFNLDDHFIGGTIQIDGWTDRHRLSVLGMVITFCDIKMVMHRKLLKLDVLNGKSTGENIATFIEEVLQSYSISDKICYTITDAGANMTCAMRLLLERTKSSTPECPEERNMEAEDVGEVDVCIANSVEVEEDGFLEDIEISNKPSLRSRHICCSHKAQLVLKDIADPKKGHDDFQSEFKYVLNLVTYIRSKPLHVRRLYKVTNKFLVPYAQTRWSSFAYVLERLVQRDVFLAVAAITRTAQIEDENFHKHLKFSVVVKQHLLWQFMLHLMAPVVDLTNTLQCDGISSHMVLPVVAKTLLCLWLIPVPHVKWESMKKFFINSFVKRFRPVCVCPVWIMACLLTYTKNCRNFFAWWHMKAVPIIGENILDIPLESEAVELAETYIPFDSRNVYVVDIHDNSKKPDHADDAFNTTFDESSELHNEIQPLGTRVDVLNIFLNEKKSSYKKQFVNKQPEHCWLHFLKEHPEARYLFDYMRAVYSLPASTASVERLFSNVGNVMSLKRNRIHIGTVESVIVVNDDIRSDRQEREKGDNVMQQSRLQQYYTWSPMLTPPVKFQDYLSDISDSDVTDFTKQILESDDQN